MSWLRLSRSWSSAVARCASVTRIGPLARLVLLAGEQGRLAEQLLEERRGHPFGPLDERVLPGQLEHEVTAVELR